MSDEIQDAKAVLLEPRSKVGAILIRVDKTGWVQRWILKAGSEASGIVAAWLLLHGGQNYAAGIGLGVASIIGFAGEWLWSWMVFKANHAKIGEAMSAPSIPVVRQPDWVQPPESSPAAKVILPLLFFAAASSSCAAPQPPPRYLAVAPMPAPLPQWEGKAPRSPSSQLIPEWEYQARTSIQKALEKHYKP